MGSVRLAGAAEPAEFLLMAPDALGHCLDRYSQVTELGDDAGEAPRVVAPHTVLFDDRPQ
jgi:hypothetical protein